MLSVVKIFTNKEEKSIKKREKIRENRAGFFRAPFLSAHENVSARGVARRA